ncbi:MAG: hypothetical protein ACK4IK_12500 [Bacteroidia bacterium]
MKKIKQINLIILFLALSNSAFSQTNNISNKWVQLGYFGENITHYGLSVGYGYAFWHSFKKKKKSHLQQLYVETNLPFFIHPGNQLVFCFVPELGYRYTKNSNWYFQFTIGTGVLRTFYLAKTFEADGNGRFKKIPMAGKWSLGSSFSLGFGKSISKEKGLSVLTQFRLINEHFYNQKMLLRPTFQLVILKNI